MELRHAHAHLAVVMMAMTARRMPNATGFFAPVFCPIQAMSFSNAGAKATASAKRMGRTKLRHECRCRVRI